MEKYNYIFTVFTPSFNRAHTLHLVFNSLLNQTIKTLNSEPLFEWIIIDDGSSDNTKEKINEFRKAADFPIRYYYQRNSGKHIAINRGVSFAEGEFFFIADSDDAFLSKTFETFYSHWNQLNEEEKMTCAGMNCFCIDGNTYKTIGDIKNLNPLELVYDLPYTLKNRIYYDRCGITKTDIMKRYPFPELKNVKFVPEGLIWNKIGRTYKRLNIKKILKVVYYQNDGISENIRKSYIRNAKSHYIYHLFNLKDNWDLLLRYDKVRFTKEVIQVNRMAIHTKIHLLNNIVNYNNHFFLALLLILFYPVSYFFSQLDIQKENTNK